MLSKFKLQTLKQKLWAIIAASFVVRVIIFFALPRTPSSLAPDEGTYASLSKWISESKPATNFPGFGEGLYLSGRSVIIPASALIKMGMNELEAIRLTSSIYGLLSLCLVAYLSSKLLYSDGSGIKSSRKLERLVVSLIWIYAFLPSHFVWSNLGLRESPNEFWLIVAFVGVFLLYREKQPRKPLIALLIFISIVCTFSSRPQVGLVLVVALLIYSLFKMKNKLTYLLIASVLAGLFAGYLVTTSFAYVSTDLYVAKEATPTPTKEATPTPTKEATPTPTNRGEINASKLCDASKSKLEYEGRNYNCIKIGTVTKRDHPSNLAEVAIDQVEAAIDQVGFIPEKQIINQVDAVSVIERLTCPWEEISEIGKYACLGFRAPYMTLTFLFRPFPFADTTSQSSTFAAAENILWILMAGLIFYRISKDKKIPFFRELAPCIIFFSLYVVGAGSYEGNMGTAFRHKSLILWIVLLLLFAVFWRGQDEAKEPQRNNSQESAV